MIEARYHDSVNVLQEMFAARADVTTTFAPFDRSEWFVLLAQTGLQPCIAIAQDGRNFAALALHEDAGRVTSLQNWYSFTWRQFAPNSELGDTLLCEIASQLRQRTHRVTLSPVPDEDASATRLASAFAAAGWRVEVSICDTNHILFTHGRPFADYWTKRPGALRTTLKRKGKKVSITIHDRFDETAWAEYEAIYASSWKPSEGEPAMLRAFAKQEGDAGRLRLGLAYFEGKAVAAQFWTIEGGTAFIHKLAHLESCKHLSAGTSLSAALFKQAMDKDRVELIDFGTGDETYKRDWMEDMRPRYQIDCLDMRQPRAWVDLARLALRRSRESEVPALAPLPFDG